MVIVTMICDIQKIKHVWWFLQFCGGGEAEWDKLGVGQTAIAVYFSHHLLQVVDGLGAVLHIVDILTVLDGPVILQLAL